MSPAKEERPTLPPCTPTRVLHLLGLLLLGQGLLVLLGILDHELPRPLAWALAVLGVLFLAVPRARHLRTERSLLRPAPSSWRHPRALVLAALGATLLVAVGGYNLAAGSTLAAPEAALVVYAALLLVAAPRLEWRFLNLRVGTLVAYSLPLVLAPLALYAFNALLTAESGAPPLRWYILHLLVTPMVLSLNLAGIPAVSHGDIVQLAGPEGPLFLTVGTVCAGLYAGILFLGVFGLFAWEAQTTPARLLAYLALGLFGLHVANLTRIVLLAYVGHRWGGVALQWTHQHAGWLLFLAWSLAYWAVVLRRLEGPGAARPAAP
ncbi:MAG TPA: exosortase/archaeosortase family protein [Candidatus Thermoplasmatota archaeon]|nr:exosortase/archaeosortase family protein [Candidatus Thermoplasmatota archaeon]